MKLNELTKKKRIEESNIIKPQPELTIGDKTFYPPFYSLNELVYDSKQQPFCKCVDEKIARWLMDFLWDNM